MKQFELYLNNVGHYYYLAKNYFSSYSIWTKWRRSRFFTEYFGFPLLVSTHRYCTFSHSSIVDAI
jgi:hypothetical protein